jgi:hypothetical protein
MEKDTMYYKKSTRIEPLTQDLAKQVAAMPGLPGERQIRGARLKFLHNHLRNGSFVGPNWAVAIHETSGETFRINGQHSSNMLANLGQEDFPEGLNVTIDTYGFTDMREDAPGLFNLFDHPRSARSDTDFMGISRAFYPEFANMDNAFLVKVASGIDANIRLRMEKADSSTKTIIYEELFPHRDHGYYFLKEEYRQFAVWLYQWRETTHFPFIGRNGVTSEILDDWRAEADFSTEFWGYVFRENHPDPEHESRELVRDLQLLSMKSKKVSADEWQKKARKYWQRYFRFRRTQGPEEVVVGMDDNGEEIVEVPEPFMISSPEEGLHP